MASLTFEGKISSGRGTHGELEVPGRDKLPNKAPKEWPSVLCKGSLNICIRQDGYPDLFEEHGLEKTVKSLDKRPIESSFEIDQGEFGNNKLVPAAEMQEKGSAQVWRALLITKEQEIGCWVLRRYGSGLRNELELVSEEHLRTEYNLEDGQEVRVSLYP